MVVDTQAIYVEHVIFWPNTREVADSHKLF